MQLFTAWVLVQGYGMDDECVSGAEVGTERLEQRGRLKGRCG